MQYESNTASSIVSLWRYPVKSMMGEEINSSLVTERGLWAIDPMRWWTSPPAKW